MVDMFGLEEAHINLLKSVFEKYNTVSKVILYGSRAKGNYRNSSDIDLTLVGNNLDFSTLVKIENDLDDLLLPYKIDLSVFKNIEDNHLIEHINRVGKVLYEKLSQ